MKENVYKDNVIVTTDKDKIENQEELEEVIENLFTLDNFNKIETVQGTVKLNEILVMELKTMNLWLNLIFLAITICFLYFVISKALKKLFYINI